MKKIDKIFFNRLVNIENLKKYVVSAKKINIRGINNRIISKDVENILSKYNFTIKELCYRLKENIPFDKRFECKVCGKNIKFEYVGFLGYRDYCSKKCSTKATSQKESVINKRETTMFRKFGAKNYMATKEFQNNRENNTFKKYGVKNYAQTKEFKNFIKNNKQEITLKAKKTFLKKYGVDSYTKTVEYHNNIDKIKNKMKQTCLAKYGVDCYNKTQEYKDRFKNKEYVKQIQDKVYIGKKKNNSFNTSKAETTIYQKLQEKFPDTKRQYKSELYPFNCDFYIPKKDLYIEYNGIWTHGKQHNKLYGFFDKNNAEHIQLLEKWKLKNTEYYNRAIKTWTQTDPLKLEVAKKNNLNYLVFWNMEEFNRWYENVEAN